MKSPEECSTCCRKIRASNRHIGERMSNVILNTVLVLATIYLVPFIIHGLITMAADLQLPEDVPHNDQRFLTLSWPKVRRAHRVIWMNKTIDFCWRSQQYMARAPMG
jgi:hypothetical protein